MSESVSQERVKIAGPTGRLAGQLSYPQGDVAFAALLVNPHPLMGGGMANTVIRSLASGLADSGVTMTFDYGGVGESDGPRVDVGGSMQRFWETGHAPEDPGRVREAQAAMSWLREQTDAPLFLIGYSFGAATAAALLDASVAGIVLISPTILHHTFESLEQGSTPKLIIFSESDFATPAEPMARWLEGLAPPVSVNNLPEAGHFYRGRETDLVDQCAGFIGSILRERKEAVCL